MPLPSDLREDPEETTVVGDVEAFMEYVESGQAKRDYYEIIAIRLRQLGTVANSHHPIHTKQTPRVV